MSDLGPTPDIVLTVGGGAPRFDKKGDRYGISKASQLRLAA